MPSPTVLSDFDGILRTAYTDVNINVVPQVTPLLAAVEKAKPGGPEGLQLNGEGLKWRVQLSRDVGLVASDSGYLGVDSIPTNKQATQDHARLYITRQIDGAAIVLTQSGQFTSAIRELVRGTKVAIKLGMEEQLQGDGKGIKGEITTYTSATSVIIQKPYGLDVGQGGLLVDKGDYLAARDATDSFATTLGAARVSAVSNSGDSCTITFESPGITGMAVGDILVAATGTSGQNSYDQNMDGLIKITNRGNSYQTLHGQSAGTYARWDAVRWAAGTDVGQADQVTEMDIVRLCVKVASKCGMDPRQKPGEWLLLGPPSLELKLAETMLPQRNFQMGNMELKGGFTATKVAGLAYVSDGFCPKGTIYLLHLKSLTWFDAADWGQVSYGSDNAWRPISGRDAYETSWRFIGNFGALARNSHGSITSYTDTERYSIAA
jgi:hypothetical protein